VYIVTLFVGKHYIQPDGAEQGFLGASYGGISARLSLRAWLSSMWSGWRICLRLVQPDTVIHWHREGFRLFWKWKSRPLKVGRKTIAPDTIRLIRDMSRANPLWGAPRIHGELLKLGVTVGQRTVAKYMIQRAGRPASQNWKTFLRNHLGHMVSVDFLIVPTLSFRMLYVFIVLSHVRRKVLHFNVTEAPSARWASQQLREAFAFTSPPQYLLRDRDSIYGLEFQRIAEALGLEQVRIAPRSPWQSLLGAQVVPPPGQCLHLIEVVVINFLSLMLFMVGRTAGNGRPIFPGLLLPIRSPWWPAARCKPSSAQ